MKFLLSSFLTIVFAFHINAQSNHGIGIDLKGGSNDNFDIGMRYEYQIKGNHGAKLAAAYSGANGLSTTIGYQYRALAYDKFKLILGIDYTYSSRDEIDSKYGLIQPGHAISLPVEARFRLFKPIWLNIGMSPSYDIHNTPDGRNKLLIKDLRIGALFNF